MRSGTFLIAILVGIFIVSLRALREDRAVLSVHNDGPAWSQDNTGSIDRTPSLTILQSLAGQLHGNLRVKSEDGTEVSVVFPTLTHNKPSVSRRKRGIYPWR